MNLIEQLADLVGFHKCYTDSFGREVFAKDEARYALLVAMGYRLDDEALLRQQIKALEEKTWRAMLPASHIIKQEEDNHTIIVSVNASKANANAKALAWQVTTESEQCIAGNITLNDLVIVGEMALGNEHFIKVELPLPELELGYHQLTVTCEHITQTCPLICAPKTCYSPKEASPVKMWGYAAQLYSLRSKNNWGMGDFGDLFNLVDKSADHQASAIGLNPLHPLYQNNPAHCSPYSPTSRCFLNSLYIDVTKVPNYSSCKAVQVLVNSNEFKEKIDFARNTTLIDYPAVADVKYQALELLFQDFKDSKENKTSRDEFEQFKSSREQDLLKLTTFDALYEHFRALDFNAYGWPQWPIDYQNPNSEAVKKFQKENAQRIEYFAFLQWLAHRQLSDVAQLANDKNMPVGLYLDLAVGCDGSGVDVWSDQNVYVSGAAVGAPPDALNTLGQDWGLTPINPVALQEQGYQPLVKALRSNMQYAGALRIDHILGLMRQYWVAPGMKADEGVYITFPLADILRIIALESRRNSCIVIGEDLGTVPDGFSEIMHDAGLLSYKVLFFECWESGFFKRPELYTEQSMVTVSTHDLPTLTGWWTGNDLKWRQKLDLYPNTEMGQAERDSRITDRQLLLSALDDLNVIDMNNQPQQAPAKMNRELSIAVQKFLAQAPSYVQLIPLEDALEIEEQVNIPGTIDEHPNWRQKLPIDLEEIWQTDSVKELALAMQQARPKH